MIYWRIMAIGFFVIGVVSIVWGQPDIRIAFAYGAFLFSWAVADILQSVSAALSSASKPGER